MDVHEAIILEKTPHPAYGWAFSVSTWVHLLLLFLLVWLPVIRPQPKEEKKEVVEFDVAKKEAPKPKPREPDPKTFQRAPAKAPPAPSGSADDRRVAVPRANEAMPPPQAKMSSPPPPESSEGPKGDRARGPAEGSGEPAEGPGRGPGVPGNSDLKRALSDFRRSLLALDGSGGGAKGGGGEGSGGSGIGSGPPSASGFGFGNLMFEGNDYDFVKKGYASQAYYAILKAWYRRLYAMSDRFEQWAFAHGNWLLDHQNRIRFVIGRNGQIVRVDLITESGCQPLDTSALDALREVVLPPLPEDFPRSEEGVMVTFVATGDIHMMRTDPQLHYAYYGY